MREKIDPYLRPLYDALHDMVPAEQIAKRMEAGDIEIAPLAFMRGRTLAHSVVILDEAQNLPLHILEQIRILSNLETDKEKLLQIILVGQLNLMPLLKSPELRQLDQRVSIRYQLKPLNEEETGAYISHRLAIANGARGVVFTPAALAVVYRYSGGIPRLINMLCDRALLAGATAHVARIDEDLVVTASEALDLKPVDARRMSWFGRLIRTRS